MPNCTADGCKAYVDDAAMYCRVHQHENKTEPPPVKVTYLGEGMVQLASGNFVRGTSGRVPRHVAEGLKGNEDREIRG